MGRDVGTGGGGLPKAEPMQWVYWAAPFNRAVK